MTLAKAEAGYEAQETRFVKLLGQVFPRGGNARQFFAFVLIGLLNTGFGYGVFAALYLLTSAPRLAIVLATVAGVVFNYFTTGQLVFRNRGVGVFLRFVVTYALICGINIALVDAAMALGVAALLAQLLALLLVVPLSFVMNKKFVFGDGS